MTKTHRDVELLDQLWRITTRSRMHCEAFLQDLIDLSLPQFLALRAARATAASPSPAEIALRLGCSRANASELLATLVRTERIARHPDGDDGRRAWMILTPRGVRTIEMAERQFASDAAMFFERLDDAEKELLLALLAKIQVPD